MKYTGLFFFRNLSEKVTQLLLILGLLVQILHRRTVEGQCQVRILGLGEYFLIDEVEVDTTLSLTFPDQGNRIAVVPRQHGDGRHNYDMDIFRIALSHHLTPSGTILCQFPIGVFHKQVGDIEIYKRDCTIYKLQQILFANCFLIRLEAGIANCGSYTVLFHLVFLLS